MTALLRDAGTFPELRAPLSNLSLTPVVPGPRAPQARGLAVGNSPEALIPLAEEISFLNAYERLSLEGSTTPPLLRESVAAKLRQAQQGLPAEFGLVVLDGWRSGDFQRALTAHYADAAVAELSDFVSSTEDPDLVAPHMTGGAVDLTLSWREIPLALGTPFDDFSDAARLDYFEGGTDESLSSPDQISRDLRRLLASSLLEQGLAPLAVEWWHWSYGDQYWAAHYHQSSSIYGQASLAQLECRAEASSEPQIREND